MKLLIISDLHYVSQDYMNKIKQNKGKVDMILTLGDIDNHKLFHIIRTFNKSDHIPVLSISGNHDAIGSLECFNGITNMDGHRRNVRGLNICGLAGAKPSQSLIGLYPYQTYCRQESNASKILKNILNRNDLDIVMSHSSPKGIHDKRETISGYSCLRDFIEEHKPKWAFHGHVHKNAHTMADNGYTKVYSIFGAAIFNTETEVMDWL